MNENQYKAKYWYGIDGHTCMNPGDIIVLNDSKVYNVTTGFDFIITNPVDFKCEYLYQPNEEILKFPNPIINSTTSESTTQIKDILDSMYQTYVKKNHDYGNSFDKSLDEEGLTAARIRMGDKWNRFKQLSKGEEALVKDESIKDTLLDLALYCVMTVNWMNNDSKKV